MKNIHLPPYTKKLNAARIDTTEKEKKNMIEYV
jgi:hypothetical protein